mmetsp:Transcript_19213/g.24733  ORF Transcript_19213/g.24733 Transcript_19213/m.24733 type:complete len:218 (+) Transcript_19213:201-854(+)|eukprot:CAMPEP_0198145136 /NCGR_PEP_ID=MMETSP1443-20131203/21159_1 /TAXON_ID=186043 /ORGANISM="Entomoneis sp., Strain CCMP2396" /LENGTH=217 /DNA_ID=CAMNT_0043808667 /DNA_START=129 /DNA_END=782 /DNA_ORIENTATION=-
MSTSPSSKSSDDNNNQDSDYLAFGTKAISIRNRENTFSAKMWWMVDTKSEDVPTRQGATPIVARCIRKYGWDEPFCRRVLTGYKQLLTIKKENQDWDSTQFSPCFFVDLLWLEHAADVTNYLHDCILLFGHVVNRDPDAFLDKKVKTKRDKATREALKDRFKKFYDADVWLNRVQPASQQPRKDPLLNISRRVCMRTAPTRTGSPEQPLEEIKMNDQ